jgi:hypothetical protein
MYLGTAIVVVLVVVLLSAPSEALKRIFGRLLIIVAVIGVGFYLMTQDRDAKDLAEGQKMISRDIEKCRTSSKDWNDDACSTMFWVSKEDGREAFMACLDGDGPKGTGHGAGGSSDDVRVRSCLGHIIVHK